MTTANLILCKPHGHKVAVDATEVQKVRKLLAAIDAADLMVELCCAVAFCDGLVVIEEDY